MIVKLVVLLSLGQAALALHPSASLVVRGTRGSGAARSPRALVKLRGGADLGAAYALALSSHPIITKSITSSTIFALSDVVGQSIDPPPGGGLDVKRTVTSALVGLLYFGPALHYWLETISRLVPGFTVKATLIKTLLGQSLFGPTITGVFFAASLMSTNGVLSGLKQWPAKIKQDLVRVWASGLCFWPFVDLIFYSFLPVKWIPLGYNAASFVWTIYLSLQAASGVSA